MSLLSSWSKNKLSNKPAWKQLALLATCFHAGFLLGLFFDPEDGDDVPLKPRLIFNGLHGVISQKIVFFITTAVRTSNPTYYKFLYDKIVRTYVQTTHAK
jgi:hypothetical protein